MISYGEGLMELNEENQIVWHYQDPDVELVHDVWKLEDGNVLFSHRFGVREVNVAKQIVWDFKIPREPGKQEVNACQPLGGGKVMILDCGNQKILEVDRSYQITASIDLPDGGSQNPHNRYMQARKTPEDTYLISYREKAQILELNSSGVTIWQHQLDKTDRPFTAIRLPSGNTLVPCITSHRMVEISPAGDIVWELNDEYDVTGFQIWFPVGAQVLQNGNVVVVNSDYHHRAGTKNDVQAFEITRDKKVVWTLQKSDLERGKIMHIICAILY
jgi:hypothetical protein